MYGSAKNFSSFFVSLCLAVGGFTASSAFAQILNPIGQIARILNPSLVETETRVGFTESRLAILASYRERPLKTGLGFRGGRSNSEDPDSSITLDLGAEYPLDSLFLIPAQRDTATDPGTFPRQFTIELSNRKDFSQRMVSYTTGTSSYPAAEGKPARFMTHGTSARFVRLTVHRGMSLAGSEVFTLSEIVVISKGRPVSFGAEVSARGSFSMPGLWGPEYLTDGRTPLGIWQGGKWAGNNRGDSIQVPTSSDTVEWEIDFGDSTAIDQINLFPLLIQGSADSFILPDEITISIDGPDGSESIQWSNPLPGSATTTPVVLRASGKPASRVRIEGTRPWTMGNTHIQALTEIEVWSDGKNIAAGKPVTRRHASREQQLTQLTDGFTTEREIIPVVSWLNQLHERQKLEADLAWLKPLHREMVAETELNTTWGSAVMLGLTFLIPVFIVERRRLINRNHLESLRKRIASDLHDDIGSNLGSISLIARTARKDLVRLQGPEEVADDLGQVESIARESSLAMRDIVWLLERRADTIGDLVQRMRDTANRLLRDIEYTIDCASCKTASKLSLDGKRHLFLFYKETIHNVYKHSKATRVSVRLWDKDDKLALEICDNGIGFDANSPTRPTSVHKLEERGRVLDGQVDVLSIPTKGTSVRLTVKRSHLIAQSQMS